jgi:phenylpropionate dioxygenase-like ring-hydroxylating dioxygenase large terminal subunit
MSVLDHWHPVLLSRRLRAAPVGVRLAGHSLVLFRDNEHRIGVLEDICPHRRMRLSLGRVVAGGRLQCPYHGWTFDACGHGESPGTPRLQAQVASYEAREAYGAIWVKAQAGGGTFPEFDVGGYRHMCTLEHPMRAPLELAVDNFSETEHTATVHEVFGFDPTRMAEVDVQVEPTDTTVRVRSGGPCKWVWLPMRFVLGMRRKYWFYSHWTTYFSPVYLAIDHWWADPVTGREAWVRWRVFVVLTPLSASETAVWSFAYARSRWLLPGGGLPLFHWLMRRKLDIEIKIDVALVEGLASLDPSIEGMKLGRFDRVLGLNRERIERLYRGRGDTPAGNGSPEASVPEPR